MITSFRKVGGSIMLTVPAQLLELMKVTHGDKCSIDFVDGKLIAQQTRPPRRSKYTVIELAKNTDFTRTEEDERWLNDSPVGNELL